MSLVYWKDFLKQEQINESDLPEKTKRQIKYIAEVEKGCKIQKSVEKQDFTKNQKWLDYNETIIEQIASFSVEKAEQEKNAEILKQQDEEQKRLADQAKAEEEAKAKAEEEAKAKAEEEAKAKAEEEKAQQQQQQQQQTEESKKKSGLFDNFF